MCGQTAAYCRGSPVEGEEEAEAHASTLTLVLVLGRGWNSCGEGVCVCWKEEVLFSLCSSVISVCKSFQVKGQIINCVAM